MPQREAQDPVERLGDALDLLAALVAMGLIVLVDDHRFGLPRVLLAAVFAFFVPGRAIVSNWRRVAAWSQVTMSIVLSLPILPLLAMIMLWAHAWHPLGLFQAEGWMSLAALALGTGRRVRRRMGIGDNAGALASRTAPGHGPSA